MPAGALRRCCRRTTRRRAAARSTWPRSALTRRRAGRRQRRGTATSAGLDLGDTIYLTAADGQGNVVSFIQSLFGSFGAGIVAGDTGITLHNRGSGFKLIAGSSRTRSARTSGRCTRWCRRCCSRTASRWVAFGVMGGDNQAQAHAQVVVNLVDFGMHVQEAGEAARVRHTGEELARRERHRRRTCGRRSSARPRRSRRPRRRWAATRPSSSTRRPACCWAARTRARTDSRSDGERDQSAMVSRTADLIRVESRLSTDRPRRSGRCVRR